jgi:hypothetical protein
MQYLHLFAGKYCNIGIEIAQKTISGRLRSRRRVCTATPRLSVDLASTFRVT